MFSISHPTRPPAAPFHSSGPFCQAFHGVQLGGWRGMLVQPLFYLLQKQRWAGSSESTALCLRKVSAYSQGAGQGRQVGTAKGRGWLSPPPRPAFPGGLCPGRRPVTPASTRLASLYRLHTPVPEPSPPGNRRLTSDSSRWAGLPRKAAQGLGP